MRKLECDPVTAEEPGRMGGSAMKSYTTYITFNTTKRQEIIDITDRLEEFLREHPVEEGLMLVSAMHITASVFVNDHEPGLWQDIQDWLEGVVAPWDHHPARKDDYLHNQTGEDNGAAHLRSLALGHQVLVPITRGRMDLGPWQRVFYGEWDGRRPKRVVVKIIGE